MSLVLAAERVFFFLGNYSRR